jgi:hypothetical protein
MRLVAHRLPLPLAQAVRHPGPGILNEESMHYFGRPITVIVGLGFPQVLGSARDALEFLLERPFHDRRPAHRAAIAACRACLSEEVDTDTARGVVEAYVRSCGILLDEPLAATAIAVKQGPVCA